jgi:hypothetical protein
VPLIVWPSLVSTLLRSDSPQQPGIQYSPANAALEQYFARSLGLSQLALGGLLLVLSGVLPLDSAIEGTPHLKQTQTTGKQIQQLTHQIVL